MEGGFAYTVRTTLPRGEAFAAWVAWLCEVHVADVCEAGASDAEVVVLDDDGATAQTVEVRYRFASREAFATYEREHAPRLRTHGLAFLADHELAPGAGAVGAPSTGEVRPWSREPKRP